MLITRGLKITLLWGNKGVGKSLLSAKITRELLNQYYKTEKKYPDLPKRKVYSCQPLSVDIEKKELHNHLEYWTNPKQLFDVRNSDIIWDEIGKDLPTGGWKDTHPKIKQIFSHLRKRGNRLWANTQCFDDIDIAFRRQCDRAFYITKLCGSPDISASLPPPRFIWGVMMAVEFNPRTVENEDDLQFSDRLQFFPKLYWISKKDVLLYDTSRELPPYMPDKLEHIELTCTKVGCKHKDNCIVKHRPI